MKRYKVPVLFSKNILPVENIYIFLLLGEINYIQITTKQLMEWKVE